MKRGAVLTLLLLAFATSVWAANPALPVIPARTFNITNYGALGNGTKDNTTNIQNTISAAVTAGGGTVEIPAGTFLSSSFTLYSGIRLQVDTNALLQMLPYGTYYGSTSQFIYFNNGHDLEICGGGAIDGQGAAWWTAYNANNSIARPLLLQLYSCDRLFIHDITFQNPPYHHCGIRDNGGNITVSNLTVNTPSPSPNTDGLNFVGTNCVIENCHISDGDDNIAMGSTGPIRDLLITNCTFGNGHGVSIGSGISDGITNLTVINCTFNGTVNGIRMKCDMGDSAPVANLNYLNLSMTNVSLPIVIYSYYNITGTPDSITPAEVLLPTNTALVTSNTPIWRDITISNLYVNSPGGDIGGIIWGPSEMPISNLTLVCITNTAPKTFDIYNAYGVNIINSQFNFSSGTTFTLCNAGVTISNNEAGRAVSIGGAASTNSLALFNSPASLSSTNLFAANPVTVSGGSLIVDSSLILPATTAQNFYIGTNGGEVSVAGNLTLNSTINIFDGGGITPGNYAVFNYEGALSGEPVLGSTPTDIPGYIYTLNTNTDGQVIVVVSNPPPMPTFNSASLSSVNQNFIVTGAGGEANGVYYVLSSTNLALPLNQWPRIATNQFDRNGNFLFTNGIAANPSQQFYSLELP